MNLTIEVKDINRVIETHTINRSYLSRFVDPDKEYPVTYTVNPDGSRNNNPAVLKGKDLTENQIAQLFSNRLL